MTKKIYTDHHIHPVNCTEQKDIETSSDNEVLMCYTDKDNNKYFVIQSSVTKKYSYTNIHFVLHRTAGPAVIKGTIEEYWLQGKKFDSKESWESQKTLLT